MKVKKIVKRYYKACLNNDKARQFKLYKKLLNKSLKHKHTEAID